MKTASKIFLAVLCLSAILGLVTDVAAQLRNSVRYGATSFIVVVDSSGNVTISPEEGSFYRIKSSSANSALQGLPELDLPSSNFNNQGMYRGALLTNPLTNPGPTTPGITKRENLSTIKPTLQAN